MSEFPSNEIEIIKLDLKNSYLTIKFDCGINDLNDFIVNDALPQQSEAINVTFLWFSKINRDLLGYITLCADSIHLFGEKKEELKKIGIYYKALPAIKICRMAVSLQFSNKGIGSKMIAFAASKAFEINKSAGCRFLTLEAKNEKNLPENKKPIHFYRKHDFYFTKERKVNSSYFPMYKDLLHALKEF